MEKYKVTGMSCAACSSRVEKVVGAVPGVKNVAVSLLTNSMGVEYEPGSDREQISKEICRAVADAGYGAEPEAEAKSSADGRRDSLKAEAEALEDHETPLLVRRLIASLCFLLPLMYVSMGHHMWGWPVPEFLHNPMANGVYQLLLTIVIMIINKKFFLSGFRGLLHKAPNMDTLVAIGAGAAFGYSTWALFAMCVAAGEEGIAAAAAYMNEFYFESAATILTLITVGKTLEARSKGKTTDAIRALMDLAPKTATILRDGKEVEVPVEDVKAGDVFVVRPGASIPVDGRVLEGESAVDESALTGESIPVDKGPGSHVSAATINSSGFLRCEALRVGQDTTISQIIQMVEDAAATKAPIAKVADKVSGVFVPVVILIALVTGAGWILAGETFGFALARAISVLVISCPCALGLATPVAIMVGNGLSARHGILFKTASSLEGAGRVRTVVLDKTGTITEGKPHVTDLFCVDGVGEEELISLALSLEGQSEHPLARAIVEYGAEQADRDRISDGDRDSADGDRQTDRSRKGDKNIFMKPERFRALPGAGVEAVLNGRRAFGGNGSLMEEHGLLTKELEEVGSRLAEAGKTPLYFGYEDQMLGIIAVADVVKEDSAQAISQLHNMGIEVIMLTGDNRRTAAAIARQTGVDEVISDVLPQEKEAVIRRLSERGSVAMVGDGINDAPALTRADVGIAIGAGADVALDAADVVLMKSGLMDVVRAIRISRQTIRNIHENLFWAFIYNVIGIPLAAGIWYIFGGILLNPMFGAAAMSLSSVCVCANALRLNFFRPENSNTDSRWKKKAEKHPMEALHLSDQRASCPVQTELSTEGISKEKGKPVKSETENSRESKREGILSENKGGDTMKKVLKIEGMMCQHCQSHVDKALNSLEGVQATVDLEQGLANVECSEGVTDAMLKDAVKEAGYEVTEIR